MTYDAAVIGGGIAGCSTATLLAEHGYDVVLIEQDTYPRHKLCGEFLSPEAQSSFEELGVLERVFERGAPSIRQTRWTTPAGTGTEHALPREALGLSRYQLDQLLFQRACRAGVDGRTDTRATDVSGSLGTGFEVALDASAVNARVVFSAHGRRARLDRSLDRPFMNDRSDYVAFKAHYTGPALADVSETVELHAVPGAYCGLAPVENERVNVCWIGTTEHLKTAGGTPESMLTALCDANPTLRKRMDGLSRVTDRFQAVSQIPLSTKDRFVDDVCMIGDAAGMIAPLCGDGMAMALQTAELVTPLATKFLDGETTPREFRRAYDEAWSTTFGRRMQIGRWVHRTAFHPSIAHLLVKGLGRFPSAAQWLIRSTRGLSLQ